jgi:hypothetical protein
MGPWLGREEVPLTIGCQGDRCLHEVSQSGSSTFHAPRPWLKA